MYYYLQEPWALRGYRGRLMCLTPVGLSVPYRPLNASLFDLLNRCDGNTPIDSPTEAENAVLNRLEQAGIVARTETPRPISSWQAYRYYDNRRVIHAAWGITGRCNARCRHCFMASDTAVKPSEFSWEDCQRLIGEMADCGVSSVMLTGGEPLLHPNFFQIVHEIARQGMCVSRIYTNGFLLTEDTLLRLEADGMRPEMVVSFDGIGTHDWMRGVSGAEEAALQAIRLCKEHGLSVRAAMNLNTVTLEKAVPTAKLLAEMGVDDLFIIRTTQTPKWLDQTRQTLTDDEYLEAQLDLVRQILPEIRRGMALRFFNGLLIAPCTTAEELSKPRHEFLNEKIPDCAWCHKTSSGFFIASDGRVLPCDACEGSSLAGGFWLSDNNVHTRSLRDILNNSEYTKVMEIGVSDVLAHNASCRACKWREICHGGICRPCGIAARAVDAGSWHHIDYAQGLLEPDPVNCRFYRGGYFERLKALLEAET